MVLPLDLVVQDIQVIQELPVYPTHTHTHTVSLCNYRNTLVYGDKCLPFLQPVPWLQLLQLVQIFPSVPLVRLLLSGRLFQTLPENIKEIKSIISLITLLPGLSSTEIPRSCDQQLRQLHRGIVGLHALLQAFNLHSIVLCVERDVCVLLAGI